jgi:thiosulfate dehydrogenase [quinone] large subunit
MLLAFYLGLCRSGRGYSVVPTSGILRAITVLRIGLGVEFIIWALDKTRAGWLSDGAPLAQILQDHAETTPAWYWEFLATVVLPNVDLFARLVTLGEWVAGISLALGFLTPVGALTGMWLTINFMGMRGVFSLEASIDRLFFLVSLVCLVTASSSAWALDARLRTQLRTFTRSVRGRGRLWEPLSFLSSQPRRQPERSASRM